MNAVTKPSSDPAIYIPSDTPPAVSGAKVAGTTPSGNLAAHTTQTQYVREESTSAGSISNSNGSPCIGNPILPFAPADLAMVLAALTSKTKDAQMAAGVNGLQLSKIQMEAKSDEAIGKIKQWGVDSQAALDKAKEAVETSWWQDIGNAIGAVCLAVVAAPLAITGFGAPLAAMAIGMAIDTCTTCENNTRALQDPPGKPVESFGNPLTQLVSCAVMGEWITVYDLKTQLAEEQDKPGGGDAKRVKELQAKIEQVDAKASLITNVVSIVVNPMAMMVNPAMVGSIVGDSMTIHLQAQLEAAINANPPDPAKVQEIRGQISEVEMYVNIGVTIAIAAVTIACTLGSGTGAAVASVAKTAATTAVQATSTISKVAITTAEVAGAAVSIASSANSIVVANIRLDGAESERDASLALAEVSKIDAKKLFIQQFMEDNQNQIKKLVQELMDNATVVSQMINSAGSTGTAMAVNLSTGKFNIA
jgi:hypothetical protein